MVGVIINKIKYIELSSYYEFEKNTLEDNVCCILDEIFLNGEEFDCLVAKKFIDELKNVSGFGFGFGFGSGYYHHTKYTNVLYDYNSNYTTNLFNYLNKFTKTQIYFVNGEKSDMEKNYIRFDDWWRRLENLIAELKNQLLKHKQWKNDYIDRDNERLDELEYY